MRTITLITDYGTRDYFAGSIKGVIASIAPDVRIVDITHEVEPHNVAHAAFVLRQIWPWFPPGTVHLAIVDPGVGTRRRIVAGRYAGQLVVAPDNGLLTWVHGELAVEALHVVAVPPLPLGQGSAVAEEGRSEGLPQVSATFHGRDIMAPVAAHLALGVEPASFGPATDHVEQLPIALCAERTGDKLCGHVIYADRFGNLVTNVHAEQLGDAQGRLRCCRVMIDQVDLGEIRSTFGDVPPGEPLAYVGSAGFLEIAVNQGSASERFGESTSVRVEISFVP